MQDLWSMESVIITTAGCARAAIPLLKWQAMPFITDASKHLCLSLTHKTISAAPQTFRCTREMRKEYKERQCNVR